MQQLSRPYQIALVVLVLVAAAWFVAVGHHSSSSGGSSGSAPAPSAPAQASSQPSGGSAGSSTTKIYHGSAPGVEGLSKDIAKAHGAVGTSESYEHHLEEKSANATAVNPSTEGASASSSSGSAAAAGAAGATATHGSGTSTTPVTGTAKAPATGTAKAPATHSTQSGTSTHAQPTTKHATSPAQSTAPKSATRPAPVVAVGAPPLQKDVEALVARGKTVLVLFWNPAAANDRTVHGEVRSVAGKNRSSLALFEANAKEVAAFGGITRQVPVYGTPTLLIVGGGGHATSLVGLQDVFSIEQAIREVKSASA